MYCGYLRTDVSGLHKRELEPSGRGRYGGAPGRTGRRGAVGYVALLDGNSAPR